MNFDEALEVLRDELARHGTALKNEYDGIIVKKLKDSNTLDEGGTSHQSHLAITGKQMDMFPYIRIPAYVDPPSDPKMKKFFVLRVCVYISSSNMDYLTGNTNTSNTDEQERVQVSVVKSVRNGKTEQLQLHLKRYDDDKFTLFRQNVHSDDYMVFFKLKNKVEYEVYGIRSSDIPSDSKIITAKMNGSFYYTANDSTLSFVNANDYTLFTPSDTDIYCTEFKSKYPKNRILFGAPGTGKSYTIKQDCIDLLGSADSSDYERVTFHSDYSYASFVGTYKPVPFIDEDGKKSITYKYVPGPFVRVLVKALRNAIAVNEGREEAKPYLLIVEEINRAHIAAVFGDVFQLLDRDGGGVSEYDIHVSEDMRDYLADKLKREPSDCEKIRIPDNMFIWASMNSADQGVFPMDTAFKRRWSFKYIGVDDEEFDAAGKEYQNDTFTVAGEKIEWNVLRRAINSKLSSDKIKLHEDKLMGSFFLKILDSNGRSIFSDSKKNEEFIELFCDKVLMYLFEDAAKTKRRDLFEGIKELDRINRYSYVCEQFRSRGMAIFGEDFKTKYYEHQLNEIKRKKDSLLRNTARQNGQDQHHTDSESD